MIRKQHSSIRSFPSITKQKALEIVAQVCNDDRREFHCYSKKPDRFKMYGVIPDEPCWFVYAPWGDGKDGMMLRSSRVIVISRMTGKVFYDGSAGDEG